MKTPNYTDTQPNETNNNILYEPNILNYDVKRNKLLIERKGRFNRYIFEPIPVDIVTKHSDVVDELININNEINDEINKPINKINSSGLIITLFMVVLLVLPNN